MREICTSGLRRGRERGGHWLCLISCVPLYSTSKPPLSFSFDRFQASRRLILLHARNRGEYRLVIGDGVICLGPKIEFSACAVVLALTSAAFGQDTIPISRTNRSILQPEEEAQIEQPSGFVAADHMTGAGGGLRKPFFTAGRQ